MTGAMSINTDAGRTELLDSRFMSRVFIAFATLAVLSVVISLGGRQLGRSIAMGGHTDDPTPVEVVIGNDVMNVPRNAIRFDAARRSGVAARLDLYLRWPDLEGYSDATRDDFNHAAGAPTIIFVSVTERLMSRDMSGRYEPIYADLTEPVDVAAPGGLSIRRFTERSGYLDEILVTAFRKGDTPYVARCLDGQAATTAIAPCERDVHLGGNLSMTYRFPRELLGQWQALDAAVVEKMGRWLRP